MRDILKGDEKPSLHAEPVLVCRAFCRLVGFTSFSRSTPPQRPIRTLQLVDWTCLWWAICLSTRWNWCPHLPEAINSKYSSTCLYARPSIIRLRYAEVEEREGSPLMAPGGWWVITSVRFILTFMGKGGRPSSTLVGRGARWSFFSCRGSAQKRPSGV